MMRNSVKYIAAALLAVTMMTGCVPDQHTAVDRDPAFGAEQNANLNLTQLHNDTLEAFGAPEDNPYVYISDVSVDGDARTNSIVIKANCFDEATDEEVKQFAAAVVRRVGEAITIQLPQYEPGNQESFGSAWQDYSLKLDIINVDNKASRLAMEVSAGGAIELNPDIETYEEDWIEQRDAMLQNVVYDGNGNIVSK